jgi:hypothetical protein
MPREVRMIRDRYGDIVATEAVPPEEREDCSSCKDTGFRWNNEGVLFYCICPRGVKKEMEKIKELPSIDMARYLPTDRVACKVCLRVINAGAEWYFNYALNHHDEFVVDPTDTPPLVTCRNCLMPAIPRDVVSMYHNRRKLRIRRKE